MFERFPARIVNIRYTVDGLHFDAAIDCNWKLHCYDNELNREETVPIELFCFDHPEWDIRMMYQELGNDQPKNRSEYSVIHHTAADFEGIIKETRDWIKEMIGPSEENKNYEKILPLF